MATWRKIHEKISRSSDVAALSLPAKWLFVNLIVHADDDGRLEGEPDTVKALVVPRESWKKQKVEEYILEIAARGMIYYWFQKGRRFIEFSKWREYQTIQTDRYVPSVYPHFNPETARDGKELGNKLETLMSSETTKVTLNYLGKCILTPVQLGSTGNEKRNLEPKEITRGRDLVNFLRINQPFLDTKSFQDVIFSDIQYRIEQNNIYIFRFLDDIIKYFIPLKSNFQRKKEEGDPRVTELFRYFSVRCEEIKHFKPQISWAKEGRLLKLRLTQYKVDELKDLIDWYLRSPISKEFGPSLSILLSANFINKWLSQREEEKEYYGE